MKNTEKQITVLAAVSQESLETKGADVEDLHMDSIKEAKARAKYFLTEDFMNACETTVRMGYAQVLVNGKCEFDYFGENS